MLSRQLDALIGLTCLAVLSGCVAATTSDLRDDENRIGVAQHSLLGVPEDGYPSYDELLGLAAMNRARTDPNNPSAGTADSCSGHRDPQPPMIHDHDASQAARFHCTHSLVNQGGLSHDSYCDLRDDIESTGCDGSAACACQAGTECWTCDTLGGCGTAYSGRMTRFGFTGTPRGECGAAGYGDFWSAVGGWVTENPCNSATVGHRNAVTGTNRNVVGTGSDFGSGCWSSYLFADFGEIDGLELPRIASAVHRPKAGSSSTEFTFYASYYDTGGSDPSSIHVVIDGTCHAMTVELGQNANYTYTHTTSLGSDGCHEYYVVAEDAAGDRAVYPAEGSYLVAVGTATCSDELYTDNRMPADCEGQGCGDEEICDNGLDDDCNGQTDDGCEGSGGSGTGGSGTGGSGTGNAGGGTAGSGADSSAASDSDEEEGCGCRLPGAPAGPGAAGGLAAAVALLLSGRRRRRPGSRRSSAAG
jgi:MYXO-CTERM domain-containing protein